LLASLFINNLCKVVINSVKTSFTSFTSFTSSTLMFRDERGVLEPQSDLLSTALAVIGFVVLAALMSQAYLGYEDRSFALENHESASLLADSLAAAPALKAESSNMLSAAALDKLSDPERTVGRARLFVAFSGNYLFLIEIRTGNEQWQWRIEPNNVEPDSLMEGREKVAASVPVVIELNPAESVPGILTVVLYKTGWM